jgi:hypothetical protein
VLDALEKRRFRHFTQHGQGFFEVKYLLLVELCIDFIYIGIVYNIFTLHDDGGPVAGQPRSREKKQKSIITFSITLGKCVSRHYLGRGNQSVDTE